VKERKENLQYEKEKLLEIIKEHIDKKEEGLLSDSTALINKIDAIIQNNIEEVMNKHTINEFT